MLRSAKKGKGNGVDSYECVVIMKRRGEMPVKRQVSLRRALELEPVKVAEYFLAQNM